MTETETEIPIKSLVSGMIGLFFAGIFVIMTWLDTWIFFSIIVIASLLVVNKNWNMFPIGIVGMFSSGVFTKMGWLDPILFFSVFVVSSLVLAQQIVSRQIDTGVSA